MKKIKLNDETLTIPTSWEEVTTETWMRLMKIKNPADETELFSALTGKPQLFFIESEDVDLDAQLWASLGWYINPIDFNSIEIERKVVMGNSTLDIPKDLGYKTFGQKVYVTQKIKEADISKNGLSLIIPDAFAAYMMPEFTGEKFDTDKLEDWKNEYVMPMPIVRVYPIGSFFLKSCIDSLGSKLNDLSQYLIQQR